MAQTTEDHSMILSLGPQHPSTHGVLRVSLKLDGEVIIEATPEIGYLHRATEKLAEKRTYPQIIILTDRLDYLSAMLNNWAYCLAVEKLLNVAIPERAEFLRIICGELQRIASHCIFVGTYGVDIGAFTPFFMAVGRERERILDLFEEICGARLTYSYVRIGGVMADAPEGWEARVSAFVADMWKKIEEYDTLLTKNPIFIDRTKGVGVIPAQQALAWGLTGGNLRASTVARDLRKDEPYGLYGQLSFDVPLGKEGDCWDRFDVRVREMRESLRIIQQCLERMKPGETMGKLPKYFRVPAGEAYGCLEAPRGELGFFIVSDGSPSPYRMHIRAPSFINLQVLPILLKGCKVSDAIAILGSIDIVLGEVDR